MAIIGAHMLLYSSETEALRALLQNTFGFPSVDAGGGWLIFALPPSELGVHPGEGPAFESGRRHEISFMCDDIHRTVAELRAKGVRFEGEPTRESYGVVITMILPGEVRVLLYQPRHATALTLTASAPPRAQPPPVQG